MIIIKTTTISQIIYWLFMNWTGTATINQPPLWANISGEDNHNTREIYGQTFKHVFNAEGTVVISHSDRQIDDTISPGSTDADWSTGFVAFKCPTIIIHHAITQHMKNQLAIKKTCRQIGCIQHTHTHTDRWRYQHLFSVCLSRCPTGFWLFFN